MEKSFIITRIVLWSIVAILLLGLLLAGIFGFRWLGLNLHSMGGFSIGFSNQYANASRYTSGNGKLSAEGIEQIAVNWTAGEVHVQVGDEDEITLEETSNRSLEPDDQLHYYLDGNTLRIQFSASKFRIFYSVPSKTLTLTIPRSLASALKGLGIHSISAGINAQEVQADNIVLHSTSGHIFLTSASCATLDLDSVSGEIKTQNVNADSVTANNVSGYTGLSGSFSQAALESISGRAELMSAICPHHLNISTVSGGILIQVPEGKGFTVSHNLVSGRFSCDFPILENSGRAVYLDGSATFTLNTVSGGMKIEPLK